MWFREDLRLFDNLALSFAAEQGLVLPIFFYPKDLGGASYWWLHHSLAELSASLAVQGVRLVLSSEDPAIELPRLAKSISAQKVVWNRVYSPTGVAEGKHLKQVLSGSDVGCQSFNSQLLTQSLVESPPSRALPIKYLPRFGGFVCKLLNLMNL